MVDDILAVDMVAEWGGSFVSDRWTCIETVSRELFWSQLDLFYIPEQQSLSLSLLTSSRRRRRDGRDQKHERSREVVDAASRFSPGGGLAQKELASKCLLGSSLAAT